jgi:hypothetical protein
MLHAEQMGLSRSTQGLLGIVILDFGRATSWSNASPTPAGRPAGCDHRRLPILRHMRISKQPDRTCRAR